MINVERLKSLTWVQARPALLRSYITFLDSGCEQDDGSQRCAKAAFWGSPMKGVFVFLIIFMLIDHSSHAATFTLLLCRFAYSLVRLMDPSPLLFHC